jgi:deazaflavin-dependent oxidoreductase (nitroreductase family)
LVQQHPAIARPPAFVRLVDPLVRRLLSMGFPMGPNTLLTVRGRKSGQPRSAGVAVVEIGTRRWVTGAYGDVQWVRNLRAAGEGEIRHKGRMERVRAVALTAPEAAAFYRDVLAPYVHRLPLLGRLASSIFARDALTDPEGAALAHPVFELLAIEPARPD